MSYSAAMIDKRTALTTLVEATLNARMSDGTRFNVDARTRGRILRARSAADRRSIMGDPVRYALVEHAGEEEETVVGLGNHAALVAHRFLVVVWIELQDAATYAASSQATFDRAIESETDGALGLLPTLRDAATLDAGDTLAEVGMPVVPPEGVSVVALGDLAPIDYAHRLEFTITLT